MIKCNCYKIICVPNIVTNDFSQMSDVIKSSQLPYETNSIITEKFTAEDSETLKCSIANQIQVSKICTLNFYILYGTFMELKLITLGKYCGL